MHHLIIKHSKQQNIITTSSLWPKSCLSIGKEVGTAAHCSTSHLISTTVIILYAWFKSPNALYLVKSWGDLYSYTLEWKYTSPGSLGRLPYSKPFARSQIATLWLLPSFVILRLEFRLDLVSSPCFFMLSTALSNSSLINNTLFFSHFLSDTTSTMVSLTHFVNFAYSCSR